jgi:O-antigen ligase
LPSFRKDPSFFLFSILCVALAVSPILRFSWDLLPQTLLHLLLIPAVFITLNNFRVRFQQIDFLFLGFFLLAAALSAAHAAPLDAVRNGSFTLLDCAIGAFFLSALPREQRRKLLLIPVIVSFFFVFAISSTAGMRSEVFINPNIVAGYFALSLPLSFLLWEQNPWPGAVLSASIFWGILITHSRVSILAAGLSAACYVFFFHKRFRAFIAPALLLLAGLLAYVSYQKGGGPAISSASLTDRLNWWSTALNMFSNNVLTGVGWGNFGNLYKVFKPSPGLNSAYAHNLLLQVLAETGLAGILCFSALLFIFFRRTLSSFKDPFVFSIFLSAASFFVCDNFNYSFFVPAVALLFFVVLGSACDNEMILRTKKLIPPYALVMPIAATVFLLMKPLLADVYLQRGIHALKQNNPAGAQKELSASIKIDPLPSEPYSKMAEACFKSYDDGKNKYFLEMAIQNELKAVKIFPKNSQYWSDLAWLYMTSGDKANAIGAISQAIAYDRFNPGYRRALEAFREGKSKEGAK